MKHDVFICSAVRTAIGDFGGSLAGVPTTNLAAQVAVEAIARARLPAEEIQQTVFGNVIHTCPEDMYLARVAAIRAGVPVSAPALTLNRLCGSGLQAVVSGYEQIRLGQANAVLAGGAENMSRAGHLLTSSRSGMKMGNCTALDMMVGALTDPFGNGHMGVTAENIAARHGISRERQDAVALESHQRAAAAISTGRFKDQILPVEVRVKGKHLSFDTDEHVRPSLEPGDLQKLRPAFSAGGTVTAGNASGINDGAAALVLVGGDGVKDHAIAPLARIVSTGLGGVSPEVMGMGPVPAVGMALQAAGLTVAEMDVIESNEAFAAQACGVADQLGFDPARLNPNGGAIALGHPIGASGAILLVKLVHELRRVSGRYGLATLCIGGGQGIAVVVEAC